MILQGRNLIIKSGSGLAIAAAKSCDINVDTEMLEVSSPTSGQWRSHINGRSGWSFSIGSLVSAGTPALQAIRLVSNANECYLEYDGERIRPAGNDEMVAAYVDGGGDFTYESFRSDHDQDYSSFMSSSYPWLFSVLDKRFSNNPRWVQAFHDLFGVTASDAASYLILMKDPEGRVWFKQSTTTGRQVGILVDDSNGDDVPEVVDMGAPVRNLLLKSGQSYSISVNVSGEYQGVTFNDVAVTGTSLCRRARVTATVGSLMQGSFEFQGTGPLTAPSQT